MENAETGPGASTGPPVDDQEVTTSYLFGLVWNLLADLMGTAAVAILFKRALRQASRRSPELAEVDIKQEGLEYRCQVPESWHMPWNGDGPSPLCDFVQELGPLLVCLTGAVAVRKLERDETLRGQRVLSPLEVEKWLKQ